MESPALDTSFTLPADSQLDLLADALGDPTRRAIFKYVAEADEAVTATDVGATFGVHRTVARSHLEKLTESGLLVSDFLHRPEGGRPPKVYRRSDTRLDLQEPVRQYQMLAELLLGALELFGEAGELLVADIGRDFGRRLVADTPGDASLQERLRPLERIGAEFTVEVAGDSVTVAAGNCLFREVATRRPRLVCLLDQAIVGGLLSGQDRPFVLREHARRSEQSDVCRLVFAAEQDSDGHLRSEVGEKGTTSARGRARGREDFDTDGQTTTRDDEAARAENAEDQE
jgi:predicted ArsR family transcriptional regulator